MYLNFLKKVTQKMADCKKRNCSQVIFREVFCHVYDKIPSPEVIWNAF